MNVSRAWLAKHVADPLPSVEALAEALTFHAFEIEDVASDDVLDVKVLPNRAADCLSHRGIARELAAILDLAPGTDPLRAPAPSFPKTAALSVSIEDVSLCRRYVGALIQGVTVGPSPAWLKEALESVGQRSINNVVDATNYVMLDLGQPLHAFDAAKLDRSTAEFKIGVRGARAGEQITTLSDENFTLPEGALLIVDDNADKPIGIAGIKGGKAAEVDASTTDLIIESANFDGARVRKTAQALALFTDASKRFQNKVSPELAAYGMQAVIDLILEIAGGTLVGVVDEYPAPAEPVRAWVSTTRVNAHLGTTYTDADVESVLSRLGFSYEKEGDTYTVTAPFERRDIELPEDLIEEVGRVLGYERVLSQELPPSEEVDQERFAGVERIKDVLVAQGFTEISTQSFAPSGDVYLANPLQDDRPALRTNLTDTMRDALSRAVYAAPRAQGPGDVKLFEIGTVFTKEGEHLALSLSYEPSGKRQAGYLAGIVERLEREALGALPAHAKQVADTVAEISLAGVDLAALGRGYTPAHASLAAFRPYSTYPFALRDIAVWTPAGTTEDDVAQVIRSEAGELLVRMDCFDQFEKEGRISYAFRLVFESMERTLTDEELNAIMERVTSVLNAREGYSVR